MYRLHLEKKGLRCLAIAESFKQDDLKSTLAGIVIRRDFIIDGFVFGSCTVGGNDATDSILEMFSKIKRDDINFILISGIIISMFNIVDITKIQKITGLPVIGVTYEESAGIEDAIKNHFPNSHQFRIEKYLALGTRSRITLHTRHDLYIRNQGCTLNEAAQLLDLFTLQGSIPEPLRLAQLLAKSI